MLRVLGLACFSRDAAAIYCTSVMKVFHVIHVAELSALMIHIVFVLPEMHLRLASCVTSSELSSVARLSSCKYIVNKCVRWYHAFLSGKKGKFCCWL